MSLYINISHEGGLEALGFYLQDHNSTSNPPNQRIVLTVTYFIITTLSRDTNKNTLFSVLTIQKGLSISQFFRLISFCHSTEDFMEKVVDMKNRFAQQGVSIIVD